MAINHNNGNPWNLNWETIIDLESGESDNDILLVRDHTSNELMFRFYNFVAWFRVRGSETSLTIIMKDISI